VGFTVTQMVLYQRRNASMGSYLITPSHINVLSHRVIDFTQAAGTLIMNVILNHNYHLHTWTQRLLSHTAYIQQHNRVCLLHL